eukprot:jgi/Picre1/28218/NNA_003624.t1
MQNAGGEVHRKGRGCPVSEVEESFLEEDLTAASSAQDQSASWEKVAESLDSKSPLEIMDHALSTFEGDVAIAFSGAEDVALIEYAHLTGKQYRVFSLDTGRLNPETYRLFDAVEKHYGIRIEYTFPEAEEVVDLVRSKGMFSFYEDGHQECCRVRKVRPLRKQLKGLKAWITGQRKDQSPGTRQGVLLWRLIQCLKALRVGLVAYQVQPAVQHVLCRGVELFKSHGCANK